jgi:phosphatidylglycerophosphate synthase
MSPDRPAWLRHLPNALSLLRIPLAAAVVVIYTPQDRARFWITLAILGVAVASDILDGRLARRLGVASEAGYILDGVADRSTYAALVLALCIHHRLGPLPAWLLLVREIFIYASRLAVRDWGPEERTLRVLSLLKGGAMRAWLAVVLAGDYAWLEHRVDLRQWPLYSLLETVLLGLTLFVSYFAIARTFVPGWRAPGSRG